MIEIAIAINMATIKGFFLNISPTKDLFNSKTTHKTFRNFADLHVINLIRMLVNSNVK